jgi:hypothetical protein
MSSEWMECTMNFDKFKNRTADEAVSFWISGTDPYNRYECRFGELRMSLDEFAALNKDFLENKNATLTKNGVTLKLTNLNEERRPLEVLSFFEMKIGRYEITNRTLVEFSGENFSLKFVDSVNMSVNIVE